MSKQDVRDWFIMIGIAVTVTTMLTYCFLFRNAAVFASACGAIVSLFGLYHWFTQRDDKIPDAK